MLIGVDVGSSGCKTIVLNPDGQIRARASQSYPTHHPRPTWAEQDPEDWYQAACATIRQCMAEGPINPAEIRGIAIDGPAHNVALLDEAGEILYPTIHWSDLRSTPQSERLQTQYGELIYQLTYCRVNPAWTLSQLLWLRENEPEVWSNLRRILVTKDYVRYRFTGLFQTDVYDAIGTQFYDVNCGAWSQQLCDLIGFDKTLLPPVAHALEIGGELLPDVAYDTGLRPGIPIVVASGDSVIEAFGIGAIEAGHCIVKLGTAANVNLVTASACPSPQSITYKHVVGSHWFTITATNSGTFAMNWFRETFCQLEVQQARSTGTDVSELINQLAADTAPGSQGLLFHPYLNGERSPYWDPHLRADFVGIHAGHELKHFVRAILEGVALSLRDCLRVVASLAQPITEYFIIGGGAKSELWCQILCDVLGQPLIKPDVEDAAYGSAMLAGVATGVFPDYQMAVEICSHQSEILEPNAEYHRIYNDYFEVYQAVTRDLAKHSHRLSQLAAP